jgi:hypothetical protein
MEEYIAPDTEGVPPYRQAWGLTHGLSGHIFPWATPFETILRRDLTDLVRDFNIRAICQDGFTDLDTLTSIGRSLVYRGKLDYYLPGWSYDSEGKYIRKGVALRHNADFIHTLTNGTMRVGHFANMWWGCALFSFAPDAYLSECYNYGNVNGENYLSIKQGQLFRGEKPVYFHDWGQVQLGDVLPWETMSPEDIRLAYGDFVRDMAIALYQTGMVPSWYLVASHKPLWRDLPVFLETVSRGFTPVPAVKGDAALERIRYGHGLNSALVLSNRDRKGKPINETIDLKYLGGMTVLPVLYTGGRKLNSIGDAEKTVIKDAIRPQENLVVVMPVALGLGKRQSVLVEGVVENGRFEKRYTYTVVVGKKTKAPIQVQPDRGYVLDAIQVNSVKAENGASIALESGTNEIRVVTRSTWLKTPESSFAGFDFSKAGIVLDAGAGGREKGVAQMMQDFIGTKCRVSPAILTEATSAQGNIILTRKATESGVALKDGNLIIAHPDAFELQQQAWEFLVMLERVDSRFLRTNFNGISGLTDTNIRMVKKMGLENQPYDDTDVGQGHQVIWSSVVRNKAVASAADKNTAPVPVLNVPVMAEGISLDGQLNEAVWGKAAVIKDFSIMDTQPPKLASQETEVRVWATAQDLYIGFTCFEDAMDRTLAYMTERDGMLWLDDDFEFRLAPGIGEGASDYPYYAFLVNQKGVKLDILQLPNQMADNEASTFVGPNWGKSGSGTAWNADWEIKTWVGKDRWIGEIRIPLASVNGAGKDTWRLNVSRNEQPNVEFSCWPHINGKSINQPSYFSVLKLNK